MSEQFKVLHGTEKEVEDSLNELHKTNWVDIKKMYADKGNLHLVIMTGRGRQRG